MNPPLSVFLQGLSRPREAHLLQTVARFHLLPESYIYGLADVRIMSDFYASFLLGKVYPHGVWFYFPVAFTIKSSLSFLLLLLLTVWAIATRRFTAWREIYFLTIPPLFYLIIAMSSGMNIGVRHILPMYLFFYVLIGGAASKLIRDNRLDDDCLQGHSIIRSPSAQATGKRNGCSMPTVYRKLSAKRRKLLPSLRKR